MERRTNDTDRNRTHLTVERLDERITPSHGGLSNLTEPPIGLVKSTVEDDSDTRVALPVTNILTTVNRDLFEPVALSENGSASPVTVRIDGKPSAHESEHVETGKDHDGADYSEIRVALPVTDILTAVTRDLFEPVALSEYGSKSHATVRIDGKPSEHASEHGETGRDHDDGASPWGHDPVAITAEGLHVTGQAKPAAPPREVPLPVLAISPTAEAPMAAISTNPRPMNVPMVGLQGWFISTPAATPLAAATPEPESGLPAEAVEAPARTEPAPLVAQPIEPDAPPAVPVPEVQSGDALARFVPFSPAALDGAVRRFLNGLKPDGDGSLCSKAITWAAVLVGGVFVGEVARRKRLPQKAAQFLSLSKLLTRTKPR